MEKSRINSLSKKSMRYKIMSYFRAHPDKFLTSEEVISKFNISKISDVLNASDLAIVCVGNDMCWYVWNNDKAKKFLKTLKTTSLYKKLPQKIKDQLPASVHLHHLFNTYPNKHFTSQELFFSLKKFSGTDRFTLSSIREALHIRFYAIKTNKNYIFGNLKILKKELKKLRKVGLMFSLKEPYTTLSLQFRRRIT